MKTTTRYRLRFSTETRRLTTKPITKKKLSELLKPAALDFAAWQQSQIGEVLPDCVVQVLTVDGFPIRSTTDGKTWRECVAPPFFMSLR